MAEPTTEELVQICKDFMLSAPPGEFMEVVADIRGILEDESMINDIVPSTFKQYNTDQYLQVESGDHKVLICNAGEVSGNEYMDPVSKEIVTFDHITHEVTGTRAASGEFDDQVEPYRAALQEQANEYVKEHYKWGTAGVYGKNDGGSFTLELLISSAKFEPKNYWTGRWRSNWKISFSPGSKPTLNGNVKIHVHYYEDGNVQLNTEKDLTCSANGGDASKMAANIIKAIKKSEHAYQGLINENISNMNNSSYKSLRRQLPITMTLIDWDKVGTLKMGGK